jgi:hypothetical protein
VLSDISTEYFSNLTQVDERWLSICYVRNIVNRVDMVLNITAWRSGWEDWFKVRTHFQWGLDSIVLCIFI